MPAIALFSVGGAVAGIVLYRRWQERNKPVNRLRRRARDVAGRLSDRLPDVDDLPAGAAPKGGAAAALLLTSVALARALRGGSDEDEIQDERDEQQQRVLGYLDRLPWRELLASVDWASLMGDLPDADDARERGKRALRNLPDTDDLRKRGKRALRAMPDADDARKHGKRLARQLPSTDDMQDGQKPALFGLGFGGLAAIAGVGYLAWRVIKG